MIKIINFSSNEERACANWRPKPRFHGYPLLQIPMKPTLSDRFLNRFVRRLPPLRLPPNIYRADARRLTPGAREVSESTSSQKPPLSHWSCPVCPRELRPFWYNHQLPWCVMKRCERRAYTPAHQKSRDKSKNPREGCTPQECLLCGVCIREGCSSNMKHPAQGAIQRSHAIYKTISL